jgi:uncharacterized protein YjiS (DUF1127 family)
LVEKLNHTNFNANNWRPKEQEVFAMMRRSLISHATDHTAKPNDRTTLGNHNNADFLDSVNRFFHRLSLYLAQKWPDKRQPLQPEHMTDYQLADIGLDRSDINNEYEKSYHWHIDLKN